MRIILGETGGLKLLLLPDQVGNHFRRHRQSEQILAIAVIQQVNAGLVGGLWSAKLQFREIVCREIVVLHGCSLKVEVSKTGFLLSCPELFSHANPFHLSLNIGKS